MNTNNVTTMINKYETKLSAAKLQVTQLETKLSLLREIQTEVILESLSSLCISSRDSYPQSFAMPCYPSLTTQAIKALSTTDLQTLDSSWNRLSPDAISPLSVDSIKSWKTGY